MKLYASLIVINQSPIRCYSQIVITMCCSLYGDSSLVLVFVVAKTHGSGCSCRRYIEPLLASEYMCISLPLPGVFVSLPGDAVCLCRCQVTLRVCVVVR